MWNEKMMLVRFAVVGIGNTLVDFVVFFLLASIGVPYVFSQVCSYSAGMMNSYVWNRTWTFQVRKKASVQEFLQFIFINLVSLSTTIVLLYLLHKLAGMQLFSSKAVATVAGMAVNFAGSRFWVFERGRR
ncbi:MULTISPECIES: GtrA family protein [Anoxybacillus]|uniref:GtrA family protein n=1 Tax=Anoxybacillus gonensis TaxID=198467 RepID=A0AAW7TKP6_9BACL|nr:MULTISPECIES: GtrA family protein [Anoxybacillus]EMI09302.1 YngA protein [Anoxybacillus gonensis]MBW9218438.1 GtrA family protein [Anoxybacillus sp. ST70]MCX8047076.1 GtrA family protein [Anoxybacillus gonensis]MDO0878857.1 GtrA family protein [Anoxybacillus gonensis]